MTSNEFPWGDPDPGKYKLGDYVGLFYSDHERYIFDNPVGVVTEIEEDRFGDGGLDEDDVPEQYVTVEVLATVGASKLFLIERPKARRKWRHVLRRNIKL